MEEQRSIEWFRKRLGCITGSQVGLLMKSSRNKSDMFGDTAKSYIYQLAAEQSMNPAIVEDDELFKIYLQQVSISSKSMAWGNEQEVNACRMYEDLTGRCIDEVGACRHQSIDNFASSPDGYYKNALTYECGVIEIKCPSQAVFMRYKDEIKNNSSLLSVKAEYFYQCQSHMMCTGATWCDFIVYCPFQTEPIHIVRIYPDNNFFASIEQRITAANSLINQIADKE